MLYFADQRHLANYGRPIVGDHYVAMEHGPVPSRIYDMIKMVRGDSFFQDTIGLNQSFDVTEHYVTPKKKADLDEFSESDLECLEESIKENQDLTFNELKEKSHDSAYKQAQEDDKVPFIEMAKIGGAQESTLHFIQLQSQNDRALAL